MQSRSFGFIGRGRITRIFLQGLSNKKALPENIKVVEPNAGKLKALQPNFPGVVSAYSISEVAEQNIVFIAVHPPVVMEIYQIEGDNSNKESDPPCTFNLWLTPDGKIIKKESGCQT